MTTITYQIANLLEKMSSPDKDYRFMATNDLMAELQKESIKLDDDSERKVVKMLLKLLEDKNGEVQNLAVKCLGPLVNKVRETQVQVIVEALCTNMVSEKAEQLRDISSIGLKTVITELHPSSSELVASICKTITARLNKAISKQTDVSVQLEALDILGDLLSRFGERLVVHHASIQEALLPQLSSPRLAVRKRSITALGYLVMYCSPHLFNVLIEFILEELAKNTGASILRTYIQCIGNITRHAGHKVGEHLERLMPYLIQYAKTAHGGENEESDDELREYCIQALESLVRRCPKEMTNHIPTVVVLCLDYLCYDPNYNYDDDQDGAMGDDHGEEMEMDGGELDGEDSEEEYSDDDDMSWKVRRASAKCLEAVIATRHDMLVDFYKAISPVLINRFKEREENVKVDIFHTYITLLRQTRSTAQSFSAEQDKKETPIELLKNQVPQIVKSLQKQFKRDKKGVKTRQGCFSLLTELVLVLPGALTEQITNLIPAIQFSLGDKSSNSNMKIDTLAFINCLLTHHPPEVFQPYVNLLVPPIISAVSDPFYKITSEALLVLQHMLRVIRPVDAGDFNYQSIVPQLYSCTLIKLKATDIDQEVKERAISCMGHIIAILGDHLSDEMGVVMPIFLDRLKNEITRLTTVKALTRIASSPLKINLNQILPEGLPIMASFLRKNQRALKLATLTLLDTLVKNYSSSLAKEGIDAVLCEVTALISESDLHISQLTLTLLTSICQSNPSALAPVVPSILPAILNLIKSPLLQGSCLQSLLEFVRVLATSGISNFGTVELLQQLTSLVYHAPNGSTIHKQAYHSISKCVAALTVDNTENSILVVKQFLRDIQSNKQSDSVNLFALLAIGEIGRYVDLRAVPQLKTTIMDAFGSQSEEVKGAASYALGGVSVGNLEEYLPFILSEIETQQRTQYLLLHSLKEVISCQSVNTVMVQRLQPFVEAIWTMLLKHCECEEEGTRNVVAECLGKLTLICPETLLPRLASYLKLPSPLARATVVTAMKFTISDQPQPIDALLKLRIGEFLATIEDGDLNVRRVALVAFNSAAHNKPSLIRDLLGQILPRLYEETKVRKELIREVEMGPFRHKVDDGLDIRKAAFECMHTLLDTCMDRLDVFDFLTHVENGLKDHYDIKMLTHLMLVRLASLCPSAVLQRLDRLTEPLKSTCLSKVNPNAVKQEFEKQDDLNRSAMRAIYALYSIPDAERNSMMADFVAQIKLTPDLNNIYEAVQKDSSTAVSNTDPFLMDVS